MTKTRGNPFSPPRRAPGIDSGVMRFAAVCAWLIMFVGCGGSSSDQGLLPWGRSPTIVPGLEAGVSADAGADLVAAADAGAPDATAAPAPDAPPSSPPDTAPPLPPDAAPVGAFGTPYPACAKPLDMNVPDEPCRHTPDVGMCRTADGYPCFRCDVPVACAYQNPTLVLKYGPLCNGARICVPLAQNCPLTGPMCTRFPTDAGS